MQKMGVHLYDVVHGHRGDHSVEGVESRTFARELVGSNRSLAVVDKTKGAVTTYFTNHRASDLVLTSISSKQD